MAKQLVVIAGLERGRVLPLDDRDVLQLGCSQTLEVCARFRDPEVARVHCEVQVHGDRVTVVDAATANGTFLNGQRISERDLQPGDVIRIGKTELKFLCDSVKSASSASLPIAQEGSLLKKTPTKEPEPPKKKAVTAEHLALLAGKTFDHFQIEVALGVGIWGRVFRARDTKTGQPVALKVLRPEFGADDETMSQFRQALKAVFPLQHPHIVKHQSAGKAGPFCWISMEYVEGKSLTQIVRRASSAGLTDWREAYRVLVQLARALEFLHQHQLVHGNITPQDVLIRDADKVTKLGDLVLAHALAHMMTQPLSTPGERPEAIQYMSPERTEGMMEVGHRSDLYSAGACVYSLLTGRPLFQAISQGDLIAKLRQDAPISPQKYQPKMDPQFEQILQKMLQKEPAERFQTATEILTELGIIGKRCGIDVSASANHISSGKT
jgi:serine/threonine protein kinase